MYDLRSVIAMATHHTPGVTHKNVSVDAPYCLCALHWWLLARVLRLCEWNHHVGSYISVFEMVLLSLLYV